MLTARAENHIRGNPDLDDTIARLQAYEQAGADVLYAPGLRTRRRDPRGVRGDLAAAQRARAARADASPRSPTPARSGSASAAGSPGWRSSAMAAAAERMRDQGDLSWLTGSARVKEWLGDAR